MKGLFCAVVLAGTLAVQGSSSISGRVITADTSAAPIRNAAVTLTNVDARLADRTTVSDAQGEFVFKDLPSGRYRLSATKAPLLRTNYGASRSDRPGTPIVVANGQAVAGLTIRMLRGAVMTGTVRESNGDPASGAVISVLPRQFVNGDLVLASMPAARTVTDDRGVYRIFGLSPGDYVIAASPSGGRGPLDQLAPGGPPRGMPPRGGARGGGANANAGGGLPPPPAGAPLVSYAPIYYPGTPASWNAGVVSVAAGVERGGLDFHLDLTPAASLSGMVTAPAGMSWSSLRADAVLVAGSPSSGLMVQTVAEVWADGRLSATGVTPGRYTLMVSASPKVPAGGASDGRTWWAETVVTIDGHDIENLALALRPGVTMAGRVVFESTSRQPPHPSSVVVRLAPARGVLAIRSVPDAIAESDGRFTIQGIASGAYRLSAMLPAGEPPARAWTLRSAMVNGRDVADSLLEVAAAGDIRNVVLTFTDHAAEVSGTLRTAPSRPESDYFVVVFPADRSLWRSWSRRIQATRPAGNGAFQVRGLPAGEYLIAATTDLDPNEWFDPTLLSTLAAAAPVRVSLAEGQKKVQDLKVGGVVRSADRTVVRGSGGGT